MDTREDLVSSSIVLQGVFDPVKFDKLYFIKNNIFNEGDFEENSLFSQNVVRISTKDLIINVSKKQISLIFKNNQIDKDKIATIISKLKIDYNFTITFLQKWFKSYDQISIITREKFFPSNSKFLNEYFNEDNSAFGYYASKDIDKGRFKIDIKPTVLKSLIGKDDLNVLCFDFNFYFKNIDDEFNAIEKIDLISKESENIIKNF